ncbi:MAG: hypothetical protein V4515_06585 [Chloroflexota bacterium]
MPRPGRSTRRCQPVRLAGLLALASLAGCGGGVGTSGVPSDAGSPPPATGTPAPGWSASDRPTLNPTATNEATAAPLPVAEIVVGDVTLVGGLGTYVIDGRGSDAPWLPFATVPALTVGSAETVTIRFSDGVPIGDWSAVIAPADDTSGSATRGVNGAALSADGLSASVGPLPVGRWVLQVRLFRADGRGDGLTYWAITVR